MNRDSRDDFDTEDQAEEPRLLTTWEVADTLQVHRSTVYRLIRTGKLPVVLYFGLSPPYRP